MWGRQPHEFFNLNYLFELQRISKRRANANSVRLLESSASASGHMQSSQLLDTSELFSFDEVDNTPTTLDL